MAVHPGSVLETELSSLLWSHSRNKLLSTVALANCDYGVPRDMYKCVSRSLDCARHACLSNVVMKLVASADMAETSLDVMSWLKHRSQADSDTR